MGNPKKTKLDPDVIAKERETLVLRREGLTFDLIAQRIGYKDESGARAAYRRALLRTLQEPAAEVRELEIDRLDALLGIVWVQAMTGDMNAVDRVLKIQERRAKYLGLDTPVRVQAEVTTYDGTAIDDKLERLIRFISSERQGEVDSGASEGGADTR